MAERPPRLVNLPEAAEYLQLSVETVSALVGAGYLVPTDDQIPLGDLKAFLARNADNGSGNLLEIEPAGIDPQALLDALDGRSEEMARRALDIFITAFPDAAGWTLSEQARFIEQARARFEAILAVTSQGVAVDDALVGDLEAVGSAAATSGSPLPQLLVILRISRDLVVQTAVELAEERGKHWGLALSLLLTRVLPAMDRLTDALASGYWAAVEAREQDASARLQHVIDHTTDGVYEADVDGRIVAVNQALASLVGLSGDELVGAPIARVLASTGRVLDVSTFERKADGEVVGFQGVVRVRTPN